VRARRDLSSTFGARWTWRSSAPLPPAASVLVTGSFHTVGDALAAFGRCPDGSDFAMDPPSFLRPQ
jgi:hypothetical protein